MTISRRDSIFVGNLEFSSQVIARCGQRRNSMTMAFVSFTETCPPGLCGSETATCGSMSESTSRHIDHHCIGRHPFHIRTNFRKAGLPTRNAVRWRVSKDSAQMSRFVTFSNGDLTRLARAIDPFCAFWGRSCLSPLLQVIQKLTSIRWKVR